MSSGELLIIFFVSLIVFGPSKLPMLANHLARFVAILNQYKQRASDFWQQQLNEHTLSQNELKAKQADEAYQLDKTKTE